MMLIVRKGSRGIGSGAPACTNSCGAAITTGGRAASSNALGEKGVGALIISLHSCRQVSQIEAAPGTATIRRTSGGRFPLKEQRASDRSKLMATFLVVLSTYQRSWS